MRVIKNVEKIYTGKKTQEISGYEIQNRRAAREAAAEGMVLLENHEHILPLQSGSKVALYGSGAVKTIKGGSGSGDVNERKTISIWTGMKNAGYQIVNEDWLSEYKCLYEIEKKAWRDRILEITGNREHVAFFRTFANHPFQIPAGSVPNVETVKKYECDTAFYIISRTAGESADRKCEKGDYYLSDEELQVLDRVCKYYDNVVLVLNSGGIIDLGFKDCYSSIKAVIQMGQCGMESGNAFADVVSGKVTFGGHLTDTWAFKYEDYPNAATFSYMDGNVHKEYYREGIYVGYRYFDTFGVMPLYCFGYGKSYTEFELTTKKVTADEETVTVEVEVKNIGDTYPGREVVQVYYSAPNGLIEKPTQELAGFAKTKLLAPGESEVVTVTFATTDMASYDSYDAAWVMEEGEYVIRVGNSSRTTKIAMTIDLDETVRTLQLKKVMKDSVLVKEIHHMLPLFELDLDDTPFNKVITISSEKMQTKFAEYEVMRRTLKDKKPEQVLTLEDVKEGKATIDELVAQLTVEEMAELCVGTERELGGGNVVGSASACVPGAAGDTTSSLMKTRKVPNLILADGPAGLRLQKHFKTDKDGNKLPGGEQFGLEIAPFAENLPEDVVDYYQYCTAIPIATTLAQSWDMDLIQRMGQIVGEEMKLFHVHLWLAPGMNIHRNPLCGRNFEYYSEDPVLAGLCAAADTKGVQSCGGQGTTIKHFAGNNQEDNRMFTNAHISERALREIYLKGFEIAVKTAQPYAIMTSYNLINGVHAANNYDLLQNVARDEWGFEGLVMTDWYTSQDTSAMGMVSPSGKYTHSSSVQCIKAGNDLQMPGQEGNRQEIVASVADGTLPLGQLQTCAYRILNVVLQSLAYDDCKPYGDQFDLEEAVTVTKA